MKIAPHNISNHYIGKQITEQDYRANKSSHTENAKRDMQVAFLHDNGTIMLRILFAKGAKEGSHIC